MISIDFDVKIDKSRLFFWHRWTLAKFAGKRYHRVERIHRRCLLNIQEKGQQQCEGAYVCLPLSPKRCSLVSSRLQRSSTVLVEKDWVWHRRKIILFVERTSGFLNSLRISCRAQGGWQNSCDAWKLQISHSELFSSEWTRWILLPLCFLFSFSADGILPFRSSFLFPHSFFFLLPLPSSSFLFLPLSSSSHLFFSFQGILRNS